MSGLCGVIQVAGPPRPVIAPDILDHMTRVMEHRGPHHHDTFLSPGIALGARTLRTGNGGKSLHAFSTENGRLWAGLDGAVYTESPGQTDRREDHLDGVGDLETIRKLYQRFGAAFAEHLRGEFSIVVSDAARRRTVLARDRLGVKPLYYARSGDVLVFASELKGVLASGLIRADLDYEAIDAYLSFGFIPGPQTPLAGVFKLLPGQRLIVDSNGEKAERYWDYPKPSGGPPRDAGDYAEELLAKLEDSVRLRLTSAAPTGVMLSGGLDSTIILALAARHMTDPVQTFSVGFAEAGEANELADARNVGRLFGTDHHELELSFLRDTIDLRELVWHLDEPVADLSALGLLALSELASRYVTVALSGAGADGVLGGFAAHRTASIAASWDRLPTTIRWAGERLGARGSARLQRGARILSARTPVARFLAAQRKVDDDLRARLFRGPLAALDGAAALRAVRSRMPEELVADPLQTYVYLDEQLSAVDSMLHYIDRSSMARSVELRVPFFDHHVVEYCATVPSDLKVRRLTRKYLLRRAARGLVPDAIIDRRKVGFLNPAVDAWFRAQTRGVVGDLLLRSDPCYAEFLDRAEVRKLVQGHADKTDSGHSGLLLAILMLEIWLSSYLPRALRPPVRARERVSVEG